MSLILSLLLTLTSVAADLEGYKTPADAIQAFLNPLKQGVGGLKAAAEVTSSINGETLDYVNKNLDAPRFGQNQGIINDLAKDMENGAKLVKAQEIDNYSRLQGKQQFITYQLEYSNGKKRDIRFKLLQPTVSGGYQMVDVVLP